jgi:hypothetical protein
MIEIEIWNPAETDRLAVLSPDQDDPRYVYESLDFSKNIHGDGTCTFDVHREPLAQHWEDLNDSNVVKLLEERNVNKESHFNVQCTGWSAALKKNGSTADINFNLGAERGSTYITDHIVTDSKLGFTAGTLKVDDFLFTTGLEFYPGKCWWDILDEICKYQQCRWYVDRDKRLCFVAKNTTIAYHVLMEDCEESSLNRNRDEVDNWYQLGYTADGSTYGYVVSENTTSQALHGMRRKWDGVSYKVSQTEAQALADTYIAEHSLLKPSSSLTTDIITNALKVQINPLDVEPREILYIPDLLATEETITGAAAINEICTWEICEIRWKDGRVAFSPGAQPTLLETMLAKYEARDRFL